MTPDTDDLLKRADAFMTRRRSFVAAGSVRAAPDQDDLPVLTEVVEEAGEEIALRAAQPDPARLQEMVEQRIEALLPARVEAALAALLPARVEEALAARLAEELPVRLEEALARRMAEVLPEEVERALPQRLAEALPAKIEAALELALAEHLAALQPRLTQAVQAWLATEIPQLVTRQLDTVAAQITREVATQFRVTLLPELDALLTPPEGKR